ncbi:MAG: hypothetical protein HKO65_17655 [Gemmatimonadetes bacterium]|nr:hypothetical protein [Gemmatimonadota bacterium]NNM06927.1 hypothetical protein [Gemmatimonadota bacterium]
MSPDRELIGDSRRRNVRRLVWTLVLGLFLGGLLTKLSELFLPDSTAREFLITSVRASVGPFSVDLVAVALTVGPLVVTLNVLTLVGIGIVAFVARSWI